MAFDYSALVTPSIGLLSQLFGRRSAGREIPGMEQALTQSLQGQLNAQTYANAAADPNSAWFRNLAAIFREQGESDAIRGIRLGEVRQQRLRARGVPAAFVYDPERRDEAADPTRMFRQAALASREQARRALLEASGKAGATVQPLGDIFKLFSQYGGYEAQRRSDIRGGISEILKVIGPEIYGRRDPDAGYAYGQSGNLGGLAW